MNKELKALRAEMKEKGIRQVSCFNGGLTADELRYNTELFRLKTIAKQLGVSPKPSHYATVLP